MKMILRLSWKNIWRSQKRSFVVIGSIAVGVWALIFLFSFLNSFNEAYLRNAIQYEYSHIQIHHPEYRLDPSLQYFISDKEKIMGFLQSNENIEAFSSRALVNGMIATSRSNQGVEIMGIDPESENAVTSLESSLKEGTYFSRERNSVLIGRDLAEKLDAKIRSKVVLTFQDKNGDITSAAFRVEGIFESKSPRVNKSVVYLKKEKLQELVQLNQFHEIAILLNDHEQAKTMANSLSEKLPDQEVLSYSELSPEFDLLQQQSQISKQVLTGIIMLALLFGIVNTMLMAVLERTRELGMLRAIGMHKSKVFGMILFETAYLSLLGGPIGIGLGILTVIYFGNEGLDLSRYAESLKDYGYDTVFYPEIGTAQYPILMVVVIATAIIGAIYPAIKAINLNPLEALRKL